MTRNWCRGLFVAFPLFVCSFSGFAQAVSGTINGMVMDTTGASIPGASVTITDQDRGRAYRAKSDSDGNFSQAHLLAGHYQLKCESAGFAAFLANAAVQVDATTRVDVTMSPAGKQTVVTVTTDIPLLISDRAEIATTLTGRE